MNGDIIDSNTILIKPINFHCTNATASSSAETNKSIFLGKWQTIFEVSASGYVCIFVMARLAQREKPQSKTEYIISKISIKISHENFF